MKVSVVIPYFNRPKVVSRAVASVLTQTHANLEVIVVDDGSEDPLELPAALGSLQDPRLRILRHDTNRNGAAARNSGVRESCGEWIAFLDSDDEWDATKLEEQLKLAGALRETAVYCRYRVFNSAKHPLRAVLRPTREIQANEPMGDYLFCNGGFIQTSGLLIPRNLALQFPFNESLSRHQDYDLLLKLRSAGIPFLMVEDPLVTVHWEELHTSSRGLDPDRSLDFVREYDGYFGSKAKAGFIFREIVSRLLRARRRQQATRILLKQIPLSRLCLRNIPRLVSLYVFADDRIPRSVNAFLALFAGKKAKRSVSTPSAVGG